MRLSDFPPFLRITNDHVLTLELRRHNSHEYQHLDTIVAII